MKKKRRMRRFVMPEISLTPLIDTALTLLVIFMVTTPMVQYSIKVNLPAGKSREAGNDQEFIVTLTKDDRMFFNSYPVQQDTLVKEVKQAMGHNSTTPVFVRADQAISYGRVIEIVDQLKGAGVKYVAMSTRHAS